MCALSRIADCGDLRIGDYSDAADAPVTKRNVLTGHVEPGFVRDQMQNPNLHAAERRNTKDTRLLDGTTLMISTSAVTSIAYAKMIVGLLRILRRNICKLTYSQAPDRALGIEGPS